MMGSFFATGINLPAFFATKIDFQKKNLFKYTAGTLTLAFLVRWAYKYIEKQQPYVNGRSLTNLGWGRGGKRNLSKKEAQLERDSRKLPNHLSWENGQTSKIELLELVEILAEVKLDGIIFFMIFN